jgi:predicted nucleic acid-binding protein
MRRVFADTVFWIAILDPGDGLHRPATSALEEVAGAQLVTSEMVLVETLNAFSVAGTQMRSAAVRMVEKLRARPNLVIVPQTPGLFEAAFQLYGSRPDKGWSMVDCASFVIMRELLIDAALTFDSDFIQAGFQALLRS